MPTRPPTGGGAAEAPPHPWLAARRRLFELCQRDGRRGRFDAAEDGARAALGQFEERVLQKPHVAPVELHALARLPAAQGHSNRRACLRRASWPAGRSTRMPGRVPAKRGVQRPVQHVPREHVHGCDLVAREACEKPKTERKRGVKIERRAHCALTKAKSTPSMSVCKPQICSSKKYQKTGKNRATEEGLRQAAAGGWPSTCRMHRSAPSLFFNHSQSASQSDHTAAGGEHIARAEHGHGHGHEAKAGGAVASAVMGRHIGNPVSRTKLVHPSTKPALSSSSCSKKSATSALLMRSPSFSHPIENLACGGTGRRGVGHKHFVLRKCKRTQHSYPAPDPKDAWGNPER